MISLLKGSIADCVRVRTPLYHPDFPYILFWSQKSGCTTVVKWFLEQIGELDKALEFGRWVHRYEQEVYKARPGYRKELQAALKAKSHKVVKIVRDPYRRAASDFLILAERGAVIPKYHWVQTHWPLVDTWLAERGLDPEAGITFLEHLEMVRQMEARGPQTVNAHLSPQYIGGEERFVQENVPIEQFEAWASAHAGEPGVKSVDFARVADSKHHHQTDPAITASLGATPETYRITRGVYRDGRFPSTAAFVNERTRAPIREAYGPDFDAYGALYGG